jgi:hypothetical protein
MPESGVNSGEGASYPVPLCEPEEVTLLELEDAISRWERAVRSIAAGFDCSDEYTHDLFDREVLHGVLNGFASANLAVPPELKARSDEADRQFIELTRGIESHVWGGFANYDKAVFWYYFRWPIK